VIISDLLLRAAAVALPDRDHPALLCTTRSCSWCACGERPARGGEAMGRLLGGSSSAVPTVHAVRIRHPRHGAGAASDLYCLYTARSPEEHVVIADQSNVCHPKMAT
jgi:hypothetical protein